MIEYANLGGDSAVTSYEIAPESITVAFRRGGTYLYTYDSAGASNIEQMKSLAQTGEGLGSFINKVVKKLYASKLA